MKRTGTAALACAAFIAGMVFVYSCGGSGGSESNAQDLVIIESKIDALALYVENMDAKIDSLVIHAQLSGSKLNTINNAITTNQASLNLLQSKVDDVKSVVDDIYSALP